MSLRAQLAYTATDTVRSAIASLGRTEDVRFSPDSRRLAIAGFSAGKCLLIDIRIEIAAGRKAIDLGGAVEVTSPSLQQPHGLDFLDAATLVVANRTGKLSVLKVPRSGSGKTKVTVPVQPIDDDGAVQELNSPGSVAVVPAGWGRKDIIVCDNYAHQVTRHRLAGWRRLRVTKNEVLLAKGLKIPDGVAVSRSRRWIAISNHRTKSVLMFRNIGSLDRQSTPDGILRGSGYPHGLRFTPDGRYVLVADAGAPFVRVYAANDDDWGGERRCARRFRVMSDEAFERGRSNKEEGGPKGIDIDRGMNVLVATSENLPLAFFDLSTVLKH